MTDPLTFPCPIGEHTPCSTYALCPHESDDRDELAQHLQEHPHDDLVQYLVGLTW